MISAAILLLKTADCTTVMKLRLYNGANIVIWIILHDRQNSFKLNQTAKWD